MLLSKLLSVKVGVGSVEYLAFDGDGNKVTASVMEFADDEFGWMKLVSYRLASSVADDNVESRSLSTEVGMKSLVSAICGDNDVKVGTSLAKMSTVGMLIKLLDFLCLACHTFSDS